MIYQISSGIHPPIECERAVKLFTDSLLEEFEDLGIELISCRKSKYIDDGYSSALISLDYIDDRDKSSILPNVMKTFEFLSGKEIDLDILDGGTIQWICKSPYRPNHKRKNWFININKIEEVPEITTDQDFRYETFRSGGKGGQNVNKVETGIRVIHIPTGISVTSTKERSQYMNKKDAIRKINMILADINYENKASQLNSIWEKGNSLVRGNPIRVYEGEDFKRVK